MARPLAASASSWAASPTGRRCATPPRPSTGSAIAARDAASSRRTAPPSGLYDYATHRPAPRPQGHHRRRRRGGAPAGHGRGADPAAGARRAGREPRAQGPRQPAVDRADAGRASRSGRSRSASAGAVNAALLAAAILALTDRTVARALDGWRATQTGERRPIAGRRRQNEVAPANADAAAGRHDRHPRRRPARPHDGARRGASSATACHIFSPRTRFAGVAGVRRADRRADIGDRAALARSPRASTSSPSNSRTSRRDPVTFAWPATRRSCPRPEVLAICPGPPARKRTSCARSASATARFPRSEQRRRRSPRAVRELGRPGGAEDRRASAMTARARCCDPRRHRPRRGLAAHGRRARRARKPSSISAARSRSIVARGARRRARGLRAGREPPREPHPRPDHRARARAARRVPKAEAVATPHRAALDLVGVLAVEMFVDRGGRGRSSTSWRRGRTIPGIGRSMPAPPASSSSSCARSAACRSARPERHSDAVMKNLIGDDVNQLARDRSTTRSARLHLYGKREARPGRKMGHVTRLSPRRG